LEPPLWGRDHRDLLRRSKSRASSAGRHPKGRNASGGRQRRCGQCEPGRTESRSRTRGTPFQADHQVQAASTNATGALACYPRYRARHRPSPGIRL